MTRLAEALGVSEAWTTRHLSARSATIQALTFDELERIAAFLNVSPLDLIPKDFGRSGGTSRHPPTPDECRPIITRPRPQKPKTRTSSVYVPAA